MNEKVAIVGHTPGHAAYLRREDGVLITGDAVITVNVNSLLDLVRRRRGLFGPPWITTWNCPLAQASIGRLGELRQRVVATGHGPPLKGDPFVGFPPVRQPKQQERNRAPH
jgi:glyoxylase-like metal-dependent hydrolase (beta-lactamase superfamily II)